jgi:hypothetical protein
MADGWGKRLMHAWNAFQDNDQTKTQMQALGPSFSYRPERTRPRIFNERTLIGAINTRLAIDAASVAIRHVRLDENGDYQEDMDSNLQDCLTVAANVDQEARQFRQDVVMTLFDYGVAAIVPVDTTLNPKITGAWDVQTMRVGQIINWYARHVTVRLYNDDPEKGGIREDVTLPKDMVAIVENPLYTVMNEPNSTLQRLVRKLALLDDVDEQSASGKLDLIIQLPYVVKTETKREEAQKRMKEIEFQMKGSQYGIAYVDGTEKVTQLNRPAENQLMNQIQYLVTLLYTQLGLTPEIMNGTAPEVAMVNYYARTIDPILAAITEAMARTFLTKTARSQGQAIIYLRDPFKLLTLETLATVADVLSRNTILTPNDFRSILGRRPSKDPNADKLMNRNMPQPPDGTQVAPADGSGELTPPDGQSEATSAQASDIMNHAFGQVNDTVDQLIKGLQSGGG